MGEVKATPNHRGYHRCSSGLGASGVASKRLKIRRRPLMLRAALSLLLATALVTAPLKVVFAQTSQQDAVQQTAPPDSSGHRLIGVPTVTDNTSRLWAPLAGKDAFADIFAEDGSLLGPAPRAMPKGTRIVLTALAVVAFTAVVLVGLLLFGVCGPEGEGCLAS